MTGARKVVTVVFTDLVESTALGERLDPEVLRHVMSRYFDAMRTTLERHGGTVEKYIGDAIMTVFGVPTLHEDDGLRAVRAAVDMRNELARLNDEQRMLDAEPWPPAGAIRFVLAGAALKALGRSAEARVALELALKMDPESELARLQLAELKGSSRIATGRTGVR